MNAARAIVLILMGVLLLKVCTLPAGNVAVVVAVLYSVVAVTLVKRIEMGKYIFVLFSILCVIYLIIFKIPRHELILTVTGLLLSYELIEFFFRYTIPVGDEEKRQILIHRHALYLVVVFSVVLGSSFGALFLFERVAFRFSESIYVNALIFSAVFFAVLFLLRYAST